MRAILAVLGLALAACSPEVPDSAAPQGVGFDSYSTYSSESARREALLEGRPLPGNPASPPGQNPVLSSLEPRAGLPPVLTDTNGTDLAGSGAQATTPTTVRTASAPGNSAISDEQNFDAVSNRESIESDAARIAAIRDARREIRPGALPQRPNGSGPNVVAFALATTNVKGQQVYRRSRPNADRRFERACAEFSTADAAQAAFLADGGPERDRKGMDPDGDGFACLWDPASYRAARR